MQAYRRKQEARTAMYRIYHRRKNRSRPDPNLHHVPKKKRNAGAGTASRKRRITIPCSCGSLGKQVYIRKEYHDRILKMLHIIGGNEVTIAGFLDNVLTYHFTQFQDEIAESFKRHMESYNL